MHDLLFRGLKKYKEVALEFIETSLLSLGIILAIYAFVASVEVVWGSSMEPNYHTGERILVEKVTEKFKPYQRGDVVVLTPSNMPGIHYIKRIVGLPGEYFKIFQCDVYISSDGQKFSLEENYLESGTCTVGKNAIEEGRSIKIPDDSYVVLGDNREVSVDSRYLGPISNSHIIGRVIFRFWPPNKVGFLD